MNLIDGQVADGTFTATRAEFTGFDVADGRYTLGFRAEDASVVEGGGQITAPVYTLELLGDATMVTVRNRHDAG